MEKLEVKKNKVVTQAKNIIVMENNERVQEQCVSCENGNKCIENGTLEPLPTNEDVLLLEQRKKKKRWRNSEEFKPSKEAVAEISGLKFLFEEEGICYH